MIEMGGTLIVALLAYGFAVVLAHHYGKDWVTPEGTATSNWKLRHDLGVALGAVSVAVCAIVCILFIASWPGRIITLAQAVILAAAGASDVRKFHLPLPFTMAGLLLSIVTLVLTKTPMMIVMFGLVWAAALIALHAALSKGSMQLGDHIATLWIAMAMPFNGMIAVILGDFANVGVARLNGLKGKKVAAAGAWLIFAAALMGLPPYVSLYQKYQDYFKTAHPKTAILPFIDETTTALDTANADLVETDNSSPDTAESMTPVAAAMPNPNAKVLLEVMSLAQYETGRLAMIDQRAERITQARRASAKVARLAAVAAQRGGTHELVEILRALSRSLAMYDVAGVQAATADLASSYDAMQAQLASTSESESSLTSTSQQQTVIKQNTGTTTE